MNYDAQVLQPMLSEESLLEAYLYVWQELMRHDELILANRYLECCPWRIRHRNEIDYARKAANRAVYHLSSDAAMSSYYAEHAVATSSALPIGPVGAGTSQFARWLWVSSSIDDESILESRPLTILDLGCQDGWMSWRLAEKGHSVTGVDFSTSIITLAKMQEYPSEVSARTRFIVSAVPSTVPISGGPWDVVLCCEMWEHVRDIAALYNYLKEAVRPSGIVIVTTPEGSWYRGMQGPTLPRWDAPREHVRSVTLRDLLNGFSADFTVEAARILPSSVPDVKGQSHACIVARRRIATC